MRADFAYDGVAEYSVFETQNPRIAMYLIAWHMIFGASMNFLTPFQVHLGISGKSRKWHKYVGIVALSIATFGAIVGSLTLAFYRIPTGLKSWIEDVVVDDAARGHGVGWLLNEAALAEAKRRGAKDVSLTSRPSREAANRLYQRIGFEARSTNVYRYKF